MASYALFDSGPSDDDLRVTKRIVSKPASCHNLHIRYNLNLVPRGFGAEEFDELAWSRCDQAIAAYWAGTIFAGRERV